MTEYRFTSAALTELREAILYYEQRENGLGTAFLNEINAHSTEYSSIQPLGINCQHERAVRGRIAKLLPVIWPTANDGTVHCSMCPLRMNR